jgi:gamma-glutamyltranspeptidase / glutathione hydrolase
VKSNVLRILFAREVLYRLDFVAQWRAHLRKILSMAFLCLAAAAILSVSEASQSATSQNASQEDNALEKTTSLQEGLAATTSAPIDSAPANALWRENTPTRPAIGTSGMVSSAHPLATRAGLDMLSEGGNAFDAAVAVGAALNVVEPMMSGIGGYGEIVIYDAKRGETRFLDPGTKFPSTLDSEVFRSWTPNYQDNRCGAKAVVTPTNLNAWETLSKDYGELEWRRLFDPAIKLADRGFDLDEITAGWIGAAFPKFPENAKNIYGSNGIPLKVGEHLVQKDLARSLGLIADRGTQALNGGELGQAIDSAMKENGGFLSLDDLRTNRARWRDTISIDYRGYKVVTASPPAASWTELLRLGIMSQFDLKAFDQNSVSYLHTFTEASKQASLAARDYASDPDVQSTPLDYLLSEEHWAEEAARIAPLRASPNPMLTTTSNTLSSCGPTSYAPTSSPATQAGHTTHFVVADKEGNVVSASQTLGDVFGSKVMPQGTGIWLNDSTAWSRFEPAGNPDDAFPSRNVLYELCPTLVMSDGKPWIAIGTPGGYTIPQTTPQMLMSMIDFGMDIQQAIAAPRVSFVSGHLAVEAGIAQDVRNGLSALGQNVEVDTSDVRGLGNAHGLTIEYDSQGKPVRYTGGSDPRGEGAAVARY